jgi:hypothetical protein
VQQGQFRDAAILFLQTAQESLDLARDAIVAAFAAVIVATKGLLGMDRETLKGATEGLGLDVYTAAQKPEGEITEVS